MSQMIKNLKIYLKDKHASVMYAMSREVNFVWNFCNAALNFFRT